MTKIKQELINECLMLSRQNEGVVYYGILCANDTTMVTRHVEIVNQYIDCGDKVYCKCQDGYLLV